MDKMYSLKRLSLLGAVLACGILLSINVASAATITVNSLSDTVASDSSCTLREALAAATNNADYNGCTGSGSYSGNNAGEYDTIVFAPGLPPTGIVTSSTLYITNSNVTIDASSVGKMVIDGNQNHRVFAIFGGNVTLKNLIIQEGKDADGNGGYEGAGIYMQGSNLSLESCSLTNNHSENSGGAIYQNGGSLTMENSTIADNKSESDGDKGTNQSYGGGIYIASGSAYIGMSTINHNESRDDVGVGGGIFVDTNGLLKIEHTLISNNIASSNHLGGGNGNGGGIYVKGSVTVSRSQITKNTVDGQGAGGAVFTEGTADVEISNSTVDNNTSTGSTIASVANASNTIVIKSSTIVNNKMKSTYDSDAAITSNTELTNSIVANNRNGNNQINDCPSAAVTSHGYNLISEDFCAGVGNDAQSKINIDPQLSLIALPGADGLTSYYTPQPGSPALDAGPATALDALLLKLIGPDQGDTPRPQGAALDIGAYEQPSPGYIQFSSSTYTGSEPNKKVILSVKRSNGSLATTFYYGTVDGTAKSPDDYAGEPKKTVTIPAGASGIDIEIPIVDDTLVENDETFGVKLMTDNNGPLLGKIANSTVTIKSDDVLQFPGMTPPPPPSFNLPLILGDYTPPTVSVQPVQSPTFNTSPTFGLTSSEKGTVSYDGSCKGNVSTIEAKTLTTVTLSLADGSPFTPSTYSDCYVSVTDASANQSAWVSVGQFTIFQQLPVVQIDPSQMPQNPNPSPNPSPNPGPSPSPNPGPSPSPNPAPQSSLCAGFTDLLLKDNGSVKANISQADCDAITYVKSIGAMTGNPNGTFGSTDNLQRDQSAKIILVTYKLFDSKQDYCASKVMFPDVTAAAWAYQYICRGVKVIVNGSAMITGYLSGPDKGFFRPARSVNNAEFFALLLRPLPAQMPSINSTSYADVPTGQWYSGYAKYVKDNQLADGTTFNPTTVVPRLKVAKAIYRLHQLGKI